MKNKNSIIILAIVLVIIGIVCAVYVCVGRNNTTGGIIAENQVRTKVSDNENIKNEVQDELELRGNAYNPEEGTDVNGNKLSTIVEAGKPMIVLYWNTKEESGMEAVKMLQKYYADYKDSVTFMLIVAMDNEEEDKTPAEEFIAENEIEIPVMYEVVLDPASTANEINNIPTLLVVNKHGEKINSMMDHITEDAIEANLDIIAENF